MRTQWWFLFEDAIDFIQAFITRLLDQPATIHFQVPIPVQGSSSRKGIVVCKVVVGSGVILVVRVADTWVMEVAVAVAALVELVVWIKVGVNMGVDVGVGAGVEMGVEVIIEITF